VNHPTVVIPRQPHVEPDETPGPVAPAAPTTEVWWGTLVLPNDLVDIVVTFEHAADGGATRATFAVPAMKVEGVKLDEVVLDAETLQFTLVKPPPYPSEQYVLRRAPGGGVAEGQMSLADNHFFLRMVRQEPGGPPRLPIVRPQTPLPPYPYVVREVVVPAPADGQLAGALTVPAGEGPFPAVLLISGSGQQDRDETVFGHRTFLVVADRLTRAGIAVLRLDDRGAGKSTGKPGTLETEIADARAALDWLRTQPEVDGKRVGVLGHSIGAVIAPELAARGGKVAFVVALAGPGLPGWELVPLQLMATMDAAGVRTEVAAKLAAAQKTLGKAVVAGKPDAVKAALRASIVEANAATGNQPLSAADLDTIVGLKLNEITDPWTVSFFKLDPRLAWRKVKAPVLAVWGAKDLQVPPAVNSKELASALSRAGNKDVTIKVVPDLNHLYQHARTGAVDEYARIEETFDPETLALIETWIVAHTAKR
jgi:pimeloyl-ACP methyl ester carboxylesterase